MKLQIRNIFQNYLSTLHGGQHKEDGEVDLNDHVHVVLCESSCCKADHDEEGGWDEDRQEVVHNQTNHRHLSNYRLFAKKY